MRLFFKIAIVISLGLVCFGSILSKTSQIETNHPISERLSISALSVILESDEVKLYEMAPPFEKGSGGLGAYQIKGEGKVFDSDSIESVKKVVLESDHYRFDPIRKCLFIPHQGIKFSKDGKEVFVFLSSSCNQIKIQYLEGFLVADFDSGIKKLNKILK